MDPADVNTLDQLAGALGQLRSEKKLSLRDLTNAARLPAHTGRQPVLSRSTASDLAAWDRACAGFEPRRRH
ncbi:hypothetical protein SAMN04488564_11720 [Lentzea waywayandensis]|uniref:Uncharacterized protein n=1 Tax=Lentzea waywayandensis TaxID=84724 RepID=A0A1I6FGM2_9PSEU|nr:hypothetical protein SAMN04488564_11720 [Lentzea waywayandensis]